MVNGRNETPAAGVEEEDESCQAKSGLGLHGIDKDELEIRQTAKSNFRKQQN